MSAAARRACIVGIGQTAFARRGGLRRSELDLACEAILAACADAGLDPGEVDGLASYAANPTHPGELQHALGAPFLRWASLAWAPGGGGTCGAVAQAASAVESGRARHVAVVRSICQGRGERYGRHQADRPQASFNAPFGLFAPAAMVALVMRRHMHEHGSRAEQLGRIALACRRNANRNPAAVMRDRTLTMDDYLGSRPIADPLRLLDCCLESDGACALIVTTRERARALRQRPVEILAASQGHEHLDGISAMGGHNMPAATYASSGTRRLAREVLAAAGITAADLDVAQLYDAFTAMVLLQLEAWGFCGPGEGGELAAGGALDWPGGSIPVNTAGGNLSEAYVHGLNLALEGVRQLRGQSTAQVDGARLCLVTGGCLEAPSSAMVLSA